MMAKRKRDPKSAKDILTSTDFLARIQESNKYVSREFQEFGLRLATNLNDMKHKALYIKLAKEVPRSKLNEAVSFALDYPTKGKSKGKIFMWKLSQIAELKLPRRKVIPKRETSQIGLI